MHRPHPIKGFLAEHRITVRGLAQRLGRDEHHLGRVINGRYKVTPELAADIAAVLGEPVERLFRPEDVGRGTRFPGDDILATR